MFYLAVVWIVSIIVSPVAGWLAYAGFRGAHAYWVSRRLVPAILLAAFGVVASVIALGFIGGAITTEYMDAQ